GSRSARAAARWANRRVGRSCPRSTRPRCSSTRPAPVVPLATARCISASAAAGRSLRSSAPSASPRTARWRRRSTAMSSGAATSLDGKGGWGGHLDIRDVCPGHRILLPIHHEGALFYLGDVHASQGDTEFTGTAAETQATVKLKLELIKGKKVPWMRIDKPGS